MSKSGIHIKKSKVGTLRKHLGTSEGKKIPVSKLRIKSTDSSAIRKKKQFAINARKWKHEYGGSIDDPPYDQLPQHPGTISSYDKGPIGRGIDNLQRSFRKNVPESFRTIMPGFSDVEDVAYLRDQFGPQGTTGGKALALGALALPAVGSRAITGIAKQFKKGDKFYRGIDVKKGQTIRPQSALDPAEHPDIKQIGKGNFWVPLRSTDNVSPNAYVATKRDIAEYFTSPYPGGTKGMITEYSLKKNNPYIVSIEDATKYLDDKLGQGKYSKWQGSQELKRQGVDGIYNDIFNEEGIQFLNTDDLNLERAMEREAHEYIQPPLKDLKKEYEYLYKGYNGVPPGPFSQCRKGISISEKRIFKQGGLIKNNVPEMEDGGGIVQPTGDPWEYVQRENQYYTRKKGAEDWIHATGGAEEAIRTNVFNVFNVQDVQDVQQPVQSEVSTPISKPTKPTQPVSAKASVGFTYLTDDKNRQGQASIQKFLTKQGHLDPSGAEIDGFMGTTTRGAIESYAQNLPDLDARLPIVKRSDQQEMLNIIGCDKSGGCAAKSGQAVSSLLKAKPYIRKVGTPDTKYVKYKNKTKDFAIPIEDAWFNKDFIVKQGGEVLYEVNVKDLKNLNGAIPQELYSILQVGDYVSLYNGSTEHTNDRNQFDESIKNEGNSHVGIIVGRNEEGIPLLYHNSGSKKGIIEPLNQNSFKLPDVRNPYKISSIYRGSNVGEQELSNLQDNPLYYTKEEYKNLSKSRIMKEHDVPEYVVESALVYPKDNNNLSKPQENMVGVLNDNNINLMYEFGLSPEEFKTVSSILIGISQSESKGGRSPKYYYKQAASLVTEGKRTTGTLLDLIPKLQKEDEASMGFLQVKPTTNFYDKDKRLNDYGRILKSAFNMNIPDKIEETSLGSLKLKDNVIQAFAIAVKNLDTLKKEPEYNPEDNTYKGIPIEYILPAMHRSPNFYKSVTQQEFLKKADKDYSNNVLDYIKENLKATHSLNQISSFRKQASGVDYLAQQN